MKATKMAVMDDKIIDKCVGKRLHHRRTMGGLSQTEVAKAIGVTFQQIQKYEKGTNAMNSGRLYQLSQFFNMPISEFFIDLSGSSNGLKFYQPEATLGYASDREILELVKAYKQINDPTIRKKLSDLLRSVAELDAK